CAGPSGASSHAPTKRPPWPSGPGSTANCAMPTNESLDEIRSLAENAVAVGERIGRALGTYRRKMDGLHKVLEIIRPQAHGYILEALAGELNAAGNDLTMLADGLILNGIDTYKLAKGVVEDARAVPSPTSGTGSDAGGEG